MSILNGKCERCGAGVQGWNHLCPACIRDEKNQQAAEQNRISNLADQEARQRAADLRKLISLREQKEAMEREAKRRAQKQALENLIAIEEEKKEVWYSRECPKCAEMVKRKAQLCKECGHEFEDWEEQRKDIEHWEQRGAKVGVDPWNKDEIIKAEAKAAYWASPEGQAEKERLEEEARRKAEEARDKEEWEAALKAAGEGTSSRIVRTEPSYEAKSSFGSAIIGLIIIVSILFFLLV
jgi:colicin import membrane protein